MKLASIALFGILSCMLGGCYHYQEVERYQNAFNNSSLQPSFTIVVKHDECTECSDVLLVKGELIIPPALQDSLPRSVYNSSSTVDIKLAGKFPAELLDPTSLWHEAGALYKITGRVIGVYDDGNVVEPLPVFYVEKWEK